MDSCNWKAVPTTSIALSQLLRACVRRAPDLLAHDPWLPFPQTSCSFAFGTDEKPLPVGALFRLWSGCASLTTACAQCGGNVHAYSFGGLASVGSLSGCCIVCGRYYSRFVGGVAAARSLIEPPLVGTEFHVSLMSAGDCFPGPREPLYRALYDLGEWYI